MKNLEKAKKLKMINKLKVVFQFVSILPILDNFWTFFFSSNKKLLFLTKKIKILFYAFLSSKLSFLNKKFFSDTLGQFLDNFWTIFLFSL